jgi:SAM-dependent methyltransferase
MHPAEFDKFADEYRSTLARNIRLSGEPPEFFARYKVRDVVALLRSMQTAVSGARILDFGSGIGTSVPFFGEMLPDAKLTCVDVSLRSLHLGQARFAGQANFVAFDGGRLPFGDGTFDCALAACVFHHIPAENHVGLFAELRRVLKTSGMLAIFEHNPFNPVTVHTVNACAFDDDAVLISAASLVERVRSGGFTTAQVRYRVFFPRFLRLLRPLEAALDWLPLGAQYLIVGRK